jgi:ABC-type multidrug transport system ATPase subunit
MIVDEPFSALDPVSIKKVRDLFLEMKREGKTLFLSTHMISEVEKIADDFIIIHKGRIVVQGNLHHFKDRTILFRAEKESMKKEELAAAALYSFEMGSRLEMLVEKDGAECLEKLLADENIFYSKKPVGLEEIFFFFLNRSEKMNDSRL